MYINKLITAYKMTYGCGDYAAMECLKKNIPLKNLKKFMNFSEMRKS